MTLLEAMSLEIPAVVTRVGGNPEIVEDGVTGMLIETGMSSPFALAIEKLHQAPDLRQRMGKAARQRFDGRFSAEAMVYQYRKIYGEHKLIPHSSLAARID